MFDETRNGSGVQYHYGTCSCVSCSCVSCEAKISYDHVAAPGYYEIGFRISIPFNLTPWALKSSNDHRDWFKRLCKDSFVLVVSMM